MKVVFNIFYGFKIVLMCFYRFRLTKFQHKNPSNLKFYRLHVDATFVKLVRDFVFNVPKHVARDMSSSNYKPFYNLALTLHIRVK
jgi:hypothetical protein